MAGHEFDLIARYFAPLSRGAAMAFGLRDDAAALRPEAGHDLVITADAMIEDIHFRRTAGPGDIARKLLRVNLSDLAAKGARPIGYFLTVALPRSTPEDWLAAFAQGLAQDQEEFHLSLMGGDTTASPDRMAFSITAVGSLPTGQMILRGGAKPGDDVYVTGTVGDAAFGLMLEEGAAMAMDMAARSELLGRLHCPTPRVAAGQALRGLAHAAIDVSDGLAQDLGHIAHASGVAMTVEAARVPLSDAARQVLAVIPDGWERILGGGDDYEIAFTAPSARRDDVAALSKRCGLAMTRIGQVQEGTGVHVLDPSGAPMTLAHKGWQHF